MTKESDAQAGSLVKLADGTVKQRNILTGTEVWTVPGRGHRPLSLPDPDSRPIDRSRDGDYCAFCHHNYLATPPEKSRLVRTRDGEWRTLTGLHAEQLDDTVAEFRRIPNLFEIVSYDYWTKNHGHEPSAEERRRMAEYLSSPTGYDHVMTVVKARLRAYGLSERQIGDTSEQELLYHATGFFSGGHDVIIARRHYTDNAESTTQLAGSGTLTPQEHYHYIRFTSLALGDLYGLNPAVRYVAAFQNWLKPAGASFDHLHKQLVAIDEHPVQLTAELGRLKRNPKAYRELLRVCVTRGLLVARNEHAVAMVGIGHRYPTLAVWPLGEPVNPWEADDTLVRSVSDLLHAMHAATGADVPCNEEWYHRPVDVSIPMRWRILLKWRISTLAGFEGGTRIYLNTIDPWTIRERMVPRLLSLRQAHSIAPMSIGDECHLDMDELGANEGALGPLA